MSIMRQKDLRPAPALIEFKGMKFLITDRPSDVTIHHYITELKKNNVATVVRVCEPSYNTDELEAQGIVVKDLAFEDGTFPPQSVVDEWFEILKQNFNPNTTTSPHSSISILKNKHFSLRNLSTKNRTGGLNSDKNDINLNTPIYSSTSPDTIKGKKITISNTSDPNMSISIREALLKHPNPINSVNTTTVESAFTNDSNKSTLQNSTNTINTITTSNIDNKPTCRYQQNPEACVAVHCVAGLGRAPVLVALALIESGLKYEAAVEMIRDKRRGAINAKQLSYLERYKPKARLKNKNGHKNSCCVQ